MTPTPETQLLPAAVLVLLRALDWAGAGGQLIPAPFGHRGWKARLGPVGCIHSWASSQHGVGGAGVLAEGE